MGVTGHHPKYRPDIDGLRGLAITIGVAFHYFPRTFPGGYIGVDVFFVISGYLITRIILAAIDCNDFSFLEFYTKRIRRLFPALFVVLVLTSLLGWYGMAAGEFKNLSRHVAGGAAFFANFVLASEVGYFDRAAELKPLLTLWSLSVEEQFYLLWPLLLVVLHRLSANFVVTFSLMLVAAFFLGREIYLVTPDESYFLPHFRFWELLFGCVLSLVPLLGSLKVRHSLSILAFSLILLSFLTISEAKPLSLALPVAAVGIFLIAGEDAFVNRYLLSSRPMVYLGLISYGLYLWHWPIISLWRIIIETEPEVGLKLLFIGMTLVLSSLSYHLVEEPCRRSKSAWIPITFTAGIFLVGALAFLTSHYEIISPRQRMGNFNGPLGLFHQKLLKDPYYSTRLPQKRGEAIRQNDCHYNRGTIGQFFAQHHLCHSTEILRPKFLLIGDSYGADIYATLSRAYPEYEFLQFTGAACSLHASQKSECMEILKQAKKLATTETTRGVVLAAGWRKDLSLLDELLEEFLALNKPVLVVGPSLGITGELPSILEKIKASESFQDVINNRVMPARFKQNKRVEELVLSHGARFFDRLSVFCPSIDSCKVLSDSGEPLLVDNGHLSVAGIDFLGKRMRDESTVEEMMKK